MKKVKKEQQALFQIKGIEVLDLSLNHPLQPLPQQITYNFNISLELKINIENKMVIVITSIDILNEDKELQFASIKASCIFEIKNFEDFLDKDSQLVSFPENILVTFNSVSISTIRGLMFSQFKGTFLHNAILPIIDPTTFIAQK